MAGGALALPVLAKQLSLGISTRGADYAYHSFGKFSAFYTIQKFFHFQKIRGAIQRSKFQLKQSCTKIEYVQGVQKASK
jgi:hypothetical protein